MNTMSEDFEEWYAGHALDYERDTIGSRECGLQWEAWQAACASRDAEIKALESSVERLLAELTIRIFHNEPYYPNTAYTARAAAETYK